MLTPTESATQELITTAYLEGVVQSKKPYLRGQWKFHAYRRDRSNGSENCWKAEDPEIGEVFLTLRTDRSYGYVKKMNLRDPAKTRNAYSVTLSAEPFGNHVRVLRKAILGEKKDNNQKGRDFVRNTLSRLFGIDVGPI